MRGRLENKGHFNPLHDTHTRTHTSARMYTHVYPHINTQTKSMHRHICTPTDMYTHHSHKYAVCAHTLSAHTVYIYIYRIYTQT